MEAIKLECETCRKPFETSQGLSSHRRQIHGGKPTGGNPKVIIASQAKKIIHDIESLEGSPAPADGQLQCYGCKYNPLDAFTPEARKVIESAMPEEGLRRALAWEYLEHCLLDDNCPDAYKHMRVLNQDYIELMGISQS